MEGRLPSLKTYNQRKGYKKHLLLFQEQNQDNKEATERKGSTHMGWRNGAGFRRCLGPHKMKLGNTCGPWTTSYPAVIYSSLTCQQLWQHSGSEKELSIRKSLVQIPFHKLAGPQGSHSAIWQITILIFFTAQL